jgi:excinuclease ABC subunit B
VNFELESSYKPTGDQPTAIEQLVQGINAGLNHQTLLGVTGSGKTFTIANVIQQINRPVLVLSHNKTLAAQLYGEFKNFFPKNAVEYYVSYYDYYQPEAFLPSSNTYIEKDLSINKEIEKLRLSTTAALLSGRRDVIVVSSVSCIYGIGNPESFHNSAVILKRGDKISRDVVLRKLVDAMYSRNEVLFERGNFRVKGDTIDIFVASSDVAYRIVMWDNEIEELAIIDPIDGRVQERIDTVTIFAANMFVMDKNVMWNAIRQIQDDLVLRVAELKEIGKHLEAARLDERVNFDLEMMREIGHCPGIENYSRYFDGRNAGTRPFCLLDFFPNWSYVWWRPFAQN